MYREETATATAAPAGIAAQEPQPKPATPLMQQKVAGMKVENLLVVAALAVVIYMVWKKK